MGAALLVRTAPLFIVLAILAIILVGAANGVEALLISLLLSIPLVLILYHEHSKLRRE